MVKDETKNCINSENRNNENAALSKDTIQKLYQRMVAEVSDYAILFLDTEGNILTWNPGASRIKGYEMDEICGKNFSVFYPAADLEKGLPQLLLAEAATKGRAAHEGWQLKKDGGKFWGSAVITALHDENGIVIGFSQVTRDLTERKKHEERQQCYADELERQNEMLKRSEERYHRMIAEVEDYAIILLDTEGNILNWNKGAEKIKGYKEQEILGKSFTIFYLPEDSARGLPQQLLASAVAKNKATHEGWRMRKDGSHFWGSIVITALHDQAGNVTGFSKVTRDLTQKKNFEDFILMQNRQLEEYAYVASHDLQEPLRKIILFSDLLQKNLENPENAKRYLSKIIDSTERMTRLIKDVLRYSQTTDAKHLRETVDLNEVINDIRKDFEVLLTDRNGQIISGNLPTITGIPIQMHQLFANLISNAIKFNENPPVITISSKIKKIGIERLAVITVADNGIGFNQAYSEKIFQMFHRLEDQKAGTGIGLALCRRIVESHGGSISASSTPGSGSIFEIRLPLN